MHPSEPLSHFVDDYLHYLYETCPTAAALDGVHAWDDLLEDVTRAGIEDHVRALAGFARRLGDINLAGLTPVEQVDHPILEAHIRGRMYALEEIRAWERNPQYYGDLVATSLATQALFAYAPEADRARRILSKLRQVPRVVAAARENIKEAAGIFVKMGLETWRGVLAFIESDLPKAFASLDDLHLLGDLADASTEATTSIGEYIAYLERDLAPRARASFRLGKKRFEQKLRYEEGIAIPVERLLTIATRELAATQEEFRRVAGRLNGADPLAAWRAAKNDHPAPGALIPTAERQVTELRQFVERRGIVSVPDGEPVIVAATPDFYRWAFASMWTPGPFETRASRAYYYLTDVDREWSAERQEEHLKDFNLPTLWTISIHEVFPGHFLQYQHARQVESKVRKSSVLAPASFVEGWAHYCEHMMIEAGFGRGDDRIRLGQLAEALVRLARFVVCIRLHAEDLSVEQGVRVFRDEAFLEEPAARREAERGTFDPTYLVYSVGKLMLLKLRQDYRDAQGGNYSLRAFHDALLAQGTAPFWAHRRLLLGDTTGDLLD